MTYPSSSGLHSHKSTEESLRAVWLNPEGWWCREPTEPVWERSQGNSHDEHEFYIKYQCSTHCIYSLLTFFFLRFCLSEEQIQISFRNKKINNKHKVFSASLIMIYHIVCTVCYAQTVVPRYEDESGWWSFSYRIRTLHRQLHGHRVNGETKKAKNRADSGNGSFLLPQLWHLRGGRYLNINEAGGIFLKQNEHQCCSNFSSVCFSYLKVYTNV